MRAFSWRRLSIGFSLTCFVVAGTAGCQSTGTRANWFSWGQKPSTTAISSATRPSANALPGPTATTNASGLANSGGNPYAQTGYQSNQTTPGGYSTGPYGTGSDTRGYATGSTSVAGAPTSGYGTPSANGPYQSPYQSGQSANTGSYSGYSTADARSGSGYPESTSTGGGTSPAGSSWNSGQWRRGGDEASAAPAAGGSSYGAGESSYGGAGAASSPYGGTSAGPTGNSPSSSYGTTPSGGYPQTSTGAASGSQQPSQYDQLGGSAPPTASRAWTSDLGESGSANSPNDYPSSTSYPQSGGTEINATTGLSGSVTPGSYRPGSTARNAGGLGSQTAPATNSYPSSDSSYPAASYPAASYPSASYPSASSGSPYPTTGQ